MSDTRERRPDSNYEPPDVAQVAADLQRALASLRRRAIAGRVLHVGLPSVLAFAMGVWGYRLEGWVAVPFTAPVGLVLAFPILTTVYQADWLSAPPPGPLLRFLFLTLPRHLATFGQSVSSKLPPSWRRVLHRLGPIDYDSRREASPTNEVDL